MMRFALSFVLLSSLLTTGIAPAWAKKNAPKPARFFVSKASVKPTAKTLTSRALTAKSLAAKALKPLTTTQIAQDTLPSIVMLEVFDDKGQLFSTGSGIVVGKNLIATNVHVIRGAASVRAMFQGKRTLPVPGVAAFDADHDLALLYANTGSVRPLLLAPEESLQKGDTVAAVGSPQGYDGSVTFGNVSNFVVEEGIPQIQTQVPISPGSSGGALIDVYGRVVGVIRASRQDAQNLNFAVPASYLRDLLNRKRPPYDSWEALDAQILPQTVAARLGGNTDKPLAGLGGISVIVSPLNSDILAQGLDQQTLAETVVQKLKDAGIPFISDPSTVPNSTHPALAVAVTTVRSSSGTYGFSVTLFLYEDTIVVRKPLAAIRGMTWAITAVGTCPSDLIKGELTGYTGVVMDRFILDYQTQNAQGVIVAH